MPVQKMPFDIEGMEVRSDEPLNAQGFLLRYAMDMVRQAKELPIFPKPEDVSYIKIENGVVSLILK